jgi:hypothetical protein
MNEEQKCQHCGGPLYIYDEEADEIHEPNCVAGDEMCWKCWLDLLARLEEAGKMREYGAWTAIAIQAFEKVVRKEHQLERAEFELERVLMRVPREDIPAYMEHTERIRERLEIHHQTLFVEPHDRRMRMFRNNREMQS